jgi:hypothetical protein
MISIVKRSGRYQKMGISLTQDHLVDTWFYYELEEDDIILDEGKLSMMEGKTFQTLHILRRMK